MDFLTALAYAAILLLALGNAFIVKRLKFEIRDEEDEEKE